MCVLLLTNAQPTEKKTQINRKPKQEQDKSSDIEQQPPFGDRKISNIQPQNRGGGVTKPTGTSYNFDKV